MPFKHRCLLLAALLALVHLSRFDAAQSPIVTDVRYYVYFAARVADGAVPHRDFFDNKTQLTSFAGAGLVTAGRALGVDPLLAMRAGYLALTGLAALLLFAIQRRLYGGSCAAGLLGMLCYLGFSLLGFLPAIGPLPKLLMGVTASLAALLALRGWWTTAGALGAVAFLDWQIGVLAGLAVFVAALCEPEQRVAQAARAAAGGLAVLAAACLYFAANGALGVAWRQVVLTSLARGESGARGQDVHRTARCRSTRRCRWPARATPGSRSSASPAWRSFRCWRCATAARTLQRLVIALGVFHFGIVAFSLTDYQAYGDLFALLGEPRVLRRAWRSTRRSVCVARLRCHAGQRRAALAVAAVVVALRRAAHRLAAARHHAAGQDRAGRRDPRRAAERRARDHRQDRRPPHRVRQLPGAALPDRKRQPGAVRLLEPRHLELLPRRHQERPFETVLAPARRACARRRGLRHATARERPREERRVRAHRARTPTTGAYGVVLLMRRTASDQGPGR